MIRWYNWQILLAGCEEYTENALQPGSGTAKKPFENRSNDDQDDQR